MFDVIVAFPKMKVAVRTSDERIVEIRYLPAKMETKAPTNSLASLAAKQLERYRDDPDTRFDLPLAVEGSPLQRAVWEAMCAIPRGRILRR